jgi:peptidoglycan/LPS O-acetylase OafA/YrhL
MGVSTTQPTTGVASPTVDVVPSASPAPLAAEPTAPAPDRRRGPDVTLPYVAGFDGLRGFALILMLLGHHGWGAIPGALFTVSMFFTLSGFLIATLMLSEWSRSGRVSLARFWERRARRLLPAAFAAVLFIVLLQWWFGVGSGSRFKGDLLSALGYVTNWRMVSSGTDYAATFSMESPVQHFWSLAIEEQFYLVFPLVFLALMWVTRRHWGVVGIVLGGCAALSYGAAWMSSAEEGNTGITYYATYTRVSEILAGVVLAFVLATSPARRFLATERGARLAHWLGVAGFAGFIALILTLGLDDPLTFRGGTLLNAVCIWLVIIACISPSPGVMVRAISIKPLRLLGAVTYTVYLFHLPVYLLIDGDRTGLSTRPLFLVRLAVTAPLVLLSYHLLECPFRFKLRMPRRRLAGLMVAPAVVVAAVVLVVPVRRSEVIDLTEAADMDNPLVSGAVEPVDGRPPDARILLVGDSVTWSMLGGLETWNEENEEQIHVDAHFAVACTLAEPGTVRALGRLEEPYESCRRMHADLPKTLADREYDAIVVTLGQKDLTDRYVDGEWRHLGDPVFDAWLQPQIDELADTLSVEGVPVLWSSASHVRIARPNDPGSDWADYPDNDPARVDRLNELIRAEIAGRPGFTILPVDEWMHQIPGGEFSTRYRADGVHFTVTGSDEFAEWLVPNVLAGVEAAEMSRSAVDAAPTTAAP